MKRAFEEKLKGAGEMGHLLDKDFWRSLAQGLSIADSPAAATLAGMQVRSRLNISTKKMMNGN